ncbi:methyltransferase domain-containing protein (plasmid) [Paenibacillus thiaminolyticus]|uniref:class I SAM-dependent methyltransferase n=1 Tax=Paenibacillus thiaminolyticus TaxID=49283 RepID=UPI00232C7767|nr:class I SAM-dependent methyltransferase [Paenibacillus thiaminolyticus]WCF11473.1 methyltransferase domain-containing protein [Paenibacillus thiaminolyticus]
MAIIQVKSSNPNFSFVIRKNPATGMLLREIRKGLGYGWFSDDNTYNVYFKDADNDVSYKRNKDEKFEYLNTTRYNSPLAVLNMINEYFDTAMKKRSEQDTYGEGITNTFYVPMVNVVHPRYIKFFQDNYSDFQLEAQQVASKSYSITITTKRTVHDLLNYVSLLMLFFAIFAEEYVDLSDSLIAKYIKVINALDSPFYIRYLFGRNILNTRERFGKYKAELEATKRNTIDLKFGNTAIQRRDKIKSMLKYDKSILDIGCGEGFYAVPFSRNIPEHFYYAVDVDDEMVKIVEQKAKKAQIENLVAYHSIESFLENYSEEKVDIILTEVVEHMELEEAFRLLQMIVNNIDFEKLIVTTPNASFNRYYSLEETFRHDDHKWEMKEEEFRTWVQSIFGLRWHIEFFGIGDSVDGIHTTQGVIIKKGS